MSLPIPKQIRFVPSDGPPAKRRRVSSAYGLPFLSLCHAMLNPHLPGAIRVVNERRNAQERNPNAQLALKMAMSVLDIPVARRLPSKRRYLKGHLGRMTIRIEMEMREIFIQKKRSRLHPF